MSAYSKGSTISFKCDKCSKAHIHVSNCNHFVFAKSYAINKGWRFYKGQAGWMARCPTCEANRNNVVIKDAI